MAILVEECSSSAWVCAVVNAASKGTAAAIHLCINRWLVAGLLLEGLSRFEVVRRPLQ
jgi:hypothetical protein